MERVLLCFGDSNTHGTMAMRGVGDRRRFARGQRWPEIMARHLGADWHVLNEGHGGRTTVHDDPLEGPHKNGARILPALLESHCPIDMVIVMLGTNDLQNRYGVGAPEIALGNERLANIIRASGCGPGQGPPDVLIVSPVPILEIGFLGDLFRGGVEASRSIAPALAEVANRLNLPFVDAGQVAQVDPVDGIHLTAEGHAAIARAVARAVHDHFG